MPARRSVPTSFPSRPRVATVRNIPSLLAVACAFSAGTAAGLAPGHALAQAERFTKVSTDPLLDIIGAYNLGIGIAVAPRVTVTGASALVRSRLTGDELDGWGASFSSKFYSDRAFTGWNLGARANYADLVRKEGVTGKAREALGGKKREESYRTMTGGFTGGYDFLFGSGFTIGLGAGVGYTGVLEAKTNDGSKAKAVKSQVTPLFEPSLGWAF